MFVVGSGVVCIFLFMWCCLRVLIYMFVCVVCWWLLVASLFVVCCLLFVVWLLLVSVCWLLFDVGCLSFVCVV